MTIQRRFEPDPQALEAGKYVKKTCHVPPIGDAPSLQSPQSPLRPRTLHMMLVLAYCAGLRIGEIVRLNLRDFEIDDRTIEIRGTKFFKSRRLPLTAQMRVLVAIEPVDGRKYAPSIDMRSRAVRTRRMGT